MSDNDDSQNENCQQEYEPSKLKRPSSVDHFFNKIDNNPKPLQVQAKAKPDANMKQTKLTFKTNSNDFSRVGNKLYENGRVKFQTKTGDTKISVNFKLADSSASRNSKPVQPKDNAVGGENQIKAHDAVLPVENRELAPELKPQKNPNQNSNRGSGNDLDASISTSYLNTRFNFRIKDGGELNFRVSRRIDLIPSKLQAHVQYFHESKPTIQIQRPTIDLTYLLPLKKFLYQLPPIPTPSPTPSSAPYRYLFSKTQTKLKSKVSSSESELRMNSILHLGRLQGDVSLGTGPVFGNNSRFYITSIEEDKKDNNNLQLQGDGQETLQAKLQLQNRLVLPHKSVFDFTFKSVLKLEQVQSQRNWKLETLVNRWGLHNVEGKYLWKFRPGHALGAMLAFNWNSNQQTWHHRWEFIFEKQGLYKLRKYGLDFSHMAMSVSDKAFGLKLQKKFWQNSKAQFTIIKKWKKGNSHYPNYGVKLCFNL